MRELIKDLLRAAVVAAINMILLSLTFLVSFWWRRHPDFSFWSVVIVGVGTMFILSVEPICNWRYVFAWGHIKERNLQPLYWGMRESSGVIRDAYAQALRDALPPRLRGTWDNDSRGLNPKERDTL